jgi:sialidase-1
MAGQLVKTPLFVARRDGYWNCRIPGLLAAPGGAVIAVCEARRGSGGDWDANDLLMRRSPDGGDTWEPARRLAAQEDYGPGPLSNATLIADRRAGRVHLLFCHNYARAFHATSADGGATFSPPREITQVFDGYRGAYDWNVIATGPGHGIQLAGGRLVAPVWLSDGGVSHRPSVAATVFSDDGGATWRRGDIVARNGDAAAGGAPIRHPSESAAVELADGRVLLNLRTESDPRRRLVAVSPDGTSGWSQPAFDDALRDPQCMASLIRYSESPDRVLFANPDNLERSLPGLWANAFDRKRLTVKMSEDGCRTWPVSRVLEEGPAAYSDLAVNAAGEVLCFYECGMLERMADTASLTLAQFDLAWLQGTSRTPIPQMNTDERSCL